MAVTNWANTEMGNWKLGTPGLSLTLCVSAGTEPGGKRGVGQLVMTRPNPARR